ncbi:MAG: DUF4336 domain-containing protein [Cyanobacteriota bacterium]|nr:DUF4336 domain-containing protein [Cyanobacteriota bacterium]
MTAASPRSNHSWPWWPLLPLYPYGRRQTLVREIVAGQVWCFEQLQGVYYVAVPIRMTVLKLRTGLLLYAPVAPTGQVRQALAELEQLHGRVCTIVLPTSSGLEHKLPVPAMARAFPDADVWVTPRQWSFPLPLPLSWLGFPSGRTRILFEQGTPHNDELDWSALGPLDLGLGTFMEAACLHRCTGSLLVTDAVVSIADEPPAVFDLDPTPLLFHARERGDQPLVDGPEQRRQGWQRLALFASYLRPESLRVPGLAETIQDSLRPGLRNRRSHFGFYPFRWPKGWQDEFVALRAQQSEGLQIAPVLERLVFPRCRRPLVSWLRQLAGLGGIERLIAAHHEAPVPCRGSSLEALATSLEQRRWAADGGSWELLASIDASLLKLGVVPATESDQI